MNAVFWLLPPIAALVGGWPILGNYFYADDFAHLFELASFGPRDFLTAPNAGHMYLVRNAVFYASYRVFGMEPSGYFALAVATHVVNALLLATLIRRLTGNAPIACLGAVLFGVSPANPGTLGWYSVYGHALAATATLLALLAVAPRPHEEDTPLPLPAARLATGAMLVASQCFGTGAAVALVFPALVILLRPATLRSRAALATLATLPVLVLLAWVAMNTLPTRLNPWGVEAAKGMATLATDYRHVGLMAAHIFAIGIDGLVLGAPYPLARYGDWVSIAAVGAFVAAVSGALLVGDRRERRTLAAFLLAGAACYLAVAAGRAALYVAYAHARLLAAFVDSTRYHYLAQAMLAVAVAMALDILGRHAPWSARASQMLASAWLLWALASAALLRPPLAHVDAIDRAEVARARTRLDASIRRQPPGASVCLPIEPVPLAIGFPGSAGVFVLFHPTNEVEGRHVYFVSDDPKVLGLREASDRLRALVLPPDACPPPAPATGSGHVPGDGGGTF